MTGLKTTPNDRSVEAFLNSIDDEKKRRDAFAVLDLMAKATGAEPMMWGSSIVGFGTYRYKYASGHAGRMASHGLLASQTEPDAVHHARFRAIRRAHGEAREV